VARKTVDAGLNETETVLGIEVLAVNIQVLADRHGLLDQVVKILGDGGSESCRVATRPNAHTRRRGVSLHFCHGVKELQHG